MPVAWYPILGYTGAGQSYTRSFDALGAYMTAVLSREDILGLLKTTPPLVENLRSVEEQIQPNGVDLTVSDIALFSSPVSWVLRTRAEFFQRLPHWFSMPWVA